MKILKKIIKLIIYLVSIISLIILGGNIKYCSNQNKEKKETTNIRLSDRGNTLPNNPYNINQLSIDTDLYHGNLIWEDYYYLLYNLDTGEVRLTDYLTSEGISTAYEPNYQFSYDFGMFQYLKYQYEKITLQEHLLESINFTFRIAQPTSLSGYVPLNIQTCFIGTDANNELLNEPYLATYNNININDLVFVEWAQITNSEFEQIENLYLVLRLENPEVSTITSLQLFFTPYLDLNLYDYTLDDFVSIEYPNLYADFLLHDYNNFIGLLEANNQGLTEENISLNNEILALEQENERLQQEYDEAFNLGLAEGQAQAFNIINFLERILLMLDSVLSVEILPYIRLWYIVAIPLVLGVVKMVLSWFR